MTPIRPRIDARVGAQQRERGEGVALHLRRRKPGVWSATVRRTPRPVKLSTIRAATPASLRACA